MMEIEIINIEDIKLYKKNAKLHPQRQIDQIIESIKQFGNNDPIAIDEKNVIIEGHGRYEALKQMGVNEVPVIKLKHLKAQQKKAYILTHNKLTMNSDFDIDILNEELEAITDIDMSIFDFEPIIDDEEEDPEDYKETTAERKGNILNLAYAQYAGAGKYDIPQLKPLKIMPNIDRWIGFNYVMSDKAPLKEKMHTGVHFFIDDYQFERVWNDPEIYADKLTEYGIVLTPDFSPYGDMPLATQIYNHYRKHWCGKFWQDRGVRVVPTIRASTDERSLDFYLDGEPTESIVAISSMWVNENGENWDMWLKEYGNMIDTLNPCKILIYGKIPSNVTHPDIVQIDKFTDKWSKKNGKTE